MSKRAAASNVSTHGIYNFFAKQFLNVKMSTYEHERLLLVKRSQPSRIACVLDDMMQRIILLYL
ncbi:hypothetical protein NC651_026618 [Populus alba x Populus x berolinensis]|nr:hypothetical protein NC651_026618 [Populus alba x Populus x berolinensis]